jgi:hypothetical protein
VPLAQAKTSSLGASKAYCFGLSKFTEGDQAGAISLFQRAIELDLELQSHMPTSAVLTRTSVSMILWTWR